MSSKEFESNDITDGAIIRNVQQSLEPKLLNKSYWSILQRKLIDCLSTFLKYHHWSSAIVK